MNALVFSNTDAQTIIEQQDGQHRLAPVQLTDGRWFLMEDILTEIPEGLYGEKLNVPYSMQPFETIRFLIPAQDDIL